MKTRRADARRGWEATALRLAASTVFALLLLLPGTAPILGHGGGEPYLSDVAAGPYSLYVWLDPLPAQTGELHITVSVNIAADGASEPVTGLPVLMRARHLDGWEVEAPATHENALNKLFYEGRLDLQQAGTWTIGLLMGDASDQVTYAIEVDIAAKPSAWQAFRGWFRVLFSRG